MALFVRDEALFLPGPWVGLCSEIGCHKLNPFAPPLLRVCIGASLLPGDDRLSSCCADCMLCTTCLRTLSRWSGNLLSNKRGASFWRCQSNTNSRCEESMQKNVQVKKILSLLRTLISSSTRIKHGEAVSKRTDLFNYPSYIYTTGFNRG